MRERIIRFEAVSSNPYAQPGIICAPSEPFVDDVGENNDRFQRLLREAFPFVRLMPGSTLDPSVGERTKEGKVYRFYFRRGNLKRCKELIRILLENKTVPMKVHRAWKDGTSIVDEELPEGTQIYGENTYEVIALLP